MAFRDYPSLIESTTQPSPLIPEMNAMVQIELASSCWRGHHSIAGLPIARLFADTTKHSRGRKTDTEIGRKQGSFLQILFNNSAHLLEDVQALT